jgi:hypothetical protein
MATPEETNAIYMDLAQAETQEAQQSTLRHVSYLATLIICDKHAGSGRSVDAAVTEAVAIWTGVVAKMRNPALYGAAP